MSLLGKLILLILINGLSLYTCAYFLPAFIMPTGLEQIVVITLLFTGLNLIVKPILKIVLAPIIWLTLGLGAFVINAGLIYSLTQISNGIIIKDLSTLLWATLVVSLVNTICHRLLLPKS